MTYTNPIWDLKMSSSIGGVGKRRGSMGGGGGLYLESFVQVSDDDAGCHVRRQLLVAGGVIIG